MSHIPLTWYSIISSLLLALGLSMLIAWTYSATYQGLSYLREFQHTLALAGVIAAMVLLAIGDEIARGVGLVGALTIIRFRSTLKDPRDLVFAFASLGTGVACGAQAHRIAIVGATVFVLAAFYTAWSPFGSRRPFDAVLRLRLPANEGAQRDFTQELQRSCRGFALVGLYDAGAETQEHVYHLRLSTPDGQPELVRKLAAVEGVEGISVMSHETSPES
jgi:uncharacterized membrane protein YhiD involved in acid resistance